VLLTLIIAVLLLAVTSWLLRGVLTRPWRDRDPHSALQMIDIAAFKNLLSVEDDAFLRRSLRARHYRIAKRARTRAIQQYLLFIANGCASVQLLLRSHAGKSSETQLRARLLSASVVRLRLASLGLWSSLWFQRMFPQLDLMSGSLVTAYDQLSVNLNLYLIPRLSEGISVRPS
jgi:hypothetical protein